MTELSAPVGDSEAIVSVPVSDDSPLSPRDAANALLDWRRKQAAQAEAPKETKEAAEPEPVPAQAEDAVPAEEATSEQPTETTEPAEEELPPIEPPRSWTKDEKEEFKSYPREAQEKIARREQDRETALRRGQNELAEQRKALEAELAKAREISGKHEQALPILLQTLQEAQLGEFSDIKTMADVEKLAAEDWPRYAKWDAHQKRIAAVTQEMKAAQDRQTEEYKKQWAKFAVDEDAKFLEAAPEMADKEKATKVADASVALLKDIGFSETDLAKLWNGEASVSLRDHRLQRLIREAARYRDAQATAPKKIAAKQIPPVQKPGVARPKGADYDQHIKNLEKQLERTGSLKDAAALMQARRAARQ